MLKAGKDLVTFLDLLYRNARKKCGMWAQVLVMHVMRLVLIKSGPPRRFNTYIYSNCTKVGTITGTGGIARVTVVAR
jgi:hypothetical protein